jgi:hypothetical protein
VILKNDHGNKFDTGSACDLVRDGSGEIRDDGDRYSDGVRAC